MLIRQAEFMLQAIACEVMPIHDENIELLVDIKNTLKAIFYEMCKKFENIEIGESIDFDLACLPEIEWLIDFIHDFLKKNYV